MEREERVDFVNPPEPKTLSDRDRTLAAPNFDENSIHRARPAVPLAQHARRASRSLPLVALAVAAGLVGGLVGILALSFYERRQTDPQPAHVNTTTTQRADAPDTAARRSQTTVTSDQTSATQQSPAQPAPAQSSAPAPNAPNAAPKNEQVADGNSQAGARASDGEATQNADGHAAQPSQRAAGGGEAEELRAALSEWITATNARDIERQMRLYEPTVGAYYLSRNASREAVRAEKEHVFARASAVDVRAGDPQIALSPDGQTATMRFRKEYQIAGDGIDKRGAVLQELRWRRTAKGWRITSERDLRIVP